MNQMTCIPPMTPMTSTNLDPTQASPRQVHHAFFEPDARWNVATGKRSAARGKRRARNLPRRGTGFSLELARVSGSTLAPQAALSLLVSVGFASTALSQVTMEPIGATLRYEVALPGGAWGSSVTINPGERVEWRAVISFTGTQNAAALGRIYYQPILSNVDNSGADATIDQLGAWRNGGVSGQGNTTLQQGILPPTGPESGDDSSTFAFGYGRVGYAFTSRSTTAGGSGALMGHRHNGGLNGVPPGEHIRIAGSNAANWYPETIPQGTVIQNNGILWGVVSDNNTASSTWFLPGTQNLALFRQAFIASSDAPATERIVTINSEAATLQRAGGSSGTDDTRFMTWAALGEGGSTATIRVGVDFVPATIIIVPASSTLTLAAFSILCAARRHRASVVPSMPSRAPRIGVS